MSAALESVEAMAEEITARSSFEIIVTPGAFLGYLDIEMASGGMTRPLFSGSATHGLDYIKGFRDALWLTDQMEHIS